MHFKNEWCDHILTLLIALMDEEDIRGKDEGGFNYYVAFKTRFLLTIRFEKKYDYRKCDL